MPQTQQRCRSCLAKIEFIEGPNGKFIPVQAVTTIYITVEDIASGKRVLRALDITDDTLPHVDTNELPAGERLDGVTLWISHFQTCPDAGSFSRRGKS